MEKEIGQIKFSETDNGFKIEITGKSLKDAMGSCCCMPMGFGVKGKSECCPPEKEDKK
jgi:hypothetical protein